MQSWPRRLRQKPASDEACVVAGGICTWAIDSSMTSVYCMPCARTFLAGLYTSHEMTHATRPTRQVAIHSNKRDPFVLGRGVSKKGLFFVEREAVEPPERGGGEGGGGGC